MDPLSWSLVNMDFGTREIALLRFEKWNPWIEISSEEELIEFNIKPNPCQVWDWEQLEPELVRVGRA